MASLAVLNAAQLVTLAGAKRPRNGHELSDLSIIPNGGFLVESGLITAVGPTDEVSRLLTKQTRTVDARDCVVLPGFVDAHTHLVFGGNRVEEYEQRSLGATYEEIAAAGGGIRRTVSLTRQATEAELLEKAIRHANWFLAVGTTTIEAKSGYGLTVEDELKILRVMRETAQETELEVVPTFLGAHAIPPECKDNRQGYIDLITKEMLPQVKAEKLAEYCDIFCERNYFSIDESRTILGKAQALGLRLRIHADQLTCNGGAELAAELGAQTADHLEQTAEAGIRAMAKAEVQPVLLPGSVYALGHERYPLARAMVEAGLAIVLATDFNPGSSPTTSMPMVMSLACTHMGLSPAEALTAVTINAAYSINRGAKLGSLELGKQADFTIFDSNDYREIPYYFGIPLVKAVYKKGRQVEKV